MQPKYLLVFGLITLLAFLCIEKLKISLFRYLVTGLIDAHADPKCTACVVTGLLGRYECWFHFSSLSLTGGFLAGNIVSKENMQTKLSFNI